MSGAQDSFRATLHQVTAQRQEQTAVVQPGWESSRRTARGNDRRIPLPQTVERRNASDGKRGHGASLKQVPDKSQASSGQVEDKSEITDPQAEAEKYFPKAIEITRKQQAKSWELRATTSLARLWQQQGRKKEAHEILAAVYNWFTEGFDTRNLQEAKELLESMRECSESQPNGTDGYG